MSDSNRSSHPPLSALVQSLSPTFETAYEDYRHIHSKPTTPMITEKDMAQSAGASVLFSTNSQLPVSAQPEDSESNHDANTLTLSPVLDFELSQILNLEGTSWAVEFTDCLRSTLSEPHSHAASDSSAMMISPINGSPEILMSPRLLPTIFQKLREAKAPFWAAVSIDIQNCLWARVSQRLIGREPTKSQFIEVCTDAINRQTTTVSPIWEAGKYTM